MAEAAKKPGRARKALVIVLVVLVAIGAWWVNDYYHADEVALAAVADEDGASDGVVVQELEGGMTAFVPANPTCGFIFYPGAKVQPEAYAPLLYQCAERGVLCVLVKPTFNLAILSADAADGVQAQFPNVRAWFIGGHSMGGVAAADYLARHEDGFDGVVFLASYPSSDLAGFGGTALSIVGTEDAVINRANYESAEAKLPDTHQEVEIAGGNHAQCGNYGDQAGDGAATISREQQQALIVDAIEDLARAA